MGIIRLLILAALIWLVWRVVRQTLLGGARQNTPPPDEHKPASQKMVRCDWCQVYTPEAQALRLEQHHFCREDHRQRWLEKHHD